MCIHYIYFKTFVSLGQVYCEVVIKTQKYSYWEPEEKIQKGKNLEQVKIFSNMSKFWLSFSDSNLEE